MNSLNKEEIQSSDFSTHQKPCRTCMDFRSWIKMHAAKENLDKAKNTNPSSAPFNIPVIEEEYQARGHQNRATQEAATPFPTNSDNNSHLQTGLAQKYGCPADSVSLGRGSWRLLHTISAYYPKKPSENLKNDMHKFLELFSKFYPCPPCAEDFRQWIKENPPDASSKGKLSKWLCDAHNEVNRKLSKPEFDCSLYDQRWLDGWKDGSCD